MADPPKSALEALAGYTVVPGELAGRPVATVWADGEVVMEVDGATTEMAEARAWEWLRCTLDVASVATSVSEPSASLLSEASQLVQARCLVGVTMHALQSTTYRQFRISGWPNMLHYELKTDGLSGNLAAELHVESEAAAMITQSLPSIAAAAREADQALVCEVDPTWYRGRGRIRALLPSNADAASVADIMVRFIAATRSLVGATLTKGNAMSIDAE
jgi:hypothetical protein